MNSIIGEIDRMRRPDEKGFSLIELMVAVAIIAILAVIAIPNFLTYQAKAKQTEAKMQLKAIHTSEVAYFSEKGYYTASLAALEWKPQTKCRYRYTAGDGFIGNPVDVGSPMNAAAPGASRGNFTALAYANIDSDPAVDTWQITYVYSINNVYSDVYERNAK